MSENMFVLVTLTHGHDRAIVGALHQVASEIFRHTFQGSPANFTLHDSNATWRKTADYAAVAVVDFVPIVK